MTWRHDPITDLDLMAYADGQLDAARRQTVEAHLAATPDDAAMVEAIIAQNAALRLAFAGIAKQPVPERLKAVLEREPRPLLRPAVKAVMKKTPDTFFLTDFIENDIALKRETELDPIRLRPHPYEFVLYYDC